MRFDIKQFGNEALNIVAQIAPTIATALGGPLAGAAAVALSEAVTGRKDSTEKDIATALLSNNTDILFKLKEADNAFKIRMRELDIDIVKLNMSDTDSARQREIKTGDVWTPRILGGVVIVGWFGLQWFLLTHVIPTEMREIVLRGLGTLDLAVGLVLGYYFGSSSGSAHKTQIMNNSTSTEK